MTTHRRWGWGDSDALDREVLTERRKAAKLVPLPKPIRSTHIAPEVTDAEWRRRQQANEQMKEGN